MYGVDPRDPRFEFFTYDKWTRSKRNAENALLIVDEAHNFRTQINIRTHKDERGVETVSITGGKRAYELLERGGKKAHKVLLLTATPFINKPYDIENLLAIVEGRDPNNETTFGEIVSNSGARYDYFKYRISYYKSVYDKNFPERREEYIPIVIDKESELGKSIRAVYSIGNPFYISSRQSTLDELKFKYILGVLNKEKNKKFVVYTSLQQYGVEPLEKILKKRKIPYGKITGKESTVIKKEAITNYNDNEDFDKRLIPCIIYP